MQNLPIQMLQGLTKLRQIANHPELIKIKEGESGKFEDVVHKPESVEAGHSFSFLNNLLSS
jgi:SNF2 family DNA or RNA helicase